MRGPRRGSRRALALTWALVLVVAACGGGGSSGSTPAVASGASTVNVASAWHNYLTASGNWATAGSGPAGSYEEDLSIAPTGTRTFAVTNTAGATSQRTTRESVNGGAAVPRQVTVYFNSDTPFGAAFSDGSCSHSQPSLLPFPLLGPIGSSGPIDIAIGSAGCPPLAILAIAFLVVTTNTWSVESDAGVTLFCVNSSSTDLLGRTIAHSSICIESAADGTLGPKARLTQSQAATGTIATRNF